MKTKALDRLKQNDYGVDRWVALLTWALLAASCLYYLADSGMAPAGKLHWNLTLLGFLLFYLGFHLATRDKPFKREPQQRIVLVILQFIVAVSLFFLVPYNFIAILMVLWAAQLPYFMALNRAIALSPLIALPHFFIYQFYWQYNDAWLSAMLFWTFTIFSMTMMGTQLREARARENEQRINRELRATQALLAEASKHAERTRIARNIHDVLGHHLTAMTINLQVAERRSTGEAQALVAKSRSIAQLLLADVREAVSEFRQSDSFDIRAALSALHVDIPGRSVSIHCPEYIAIHSVDLAEATVAIVQESLTNFLRHSNGSHYRAEIEQGSGRLQVFTQDNGSNNTSVKPGNGLQGLRDRVEQLGGSLQIDDSDGVSLRVSLPLPEAL